jgi:hypothetical protein
MTHCFFFARGKSWCTILTGAPPALLAAAGVRGMFGPSFLAIFVSSLLN